MPIKWWFIYNKTVRWLRVFQKEKIKYSSFTSCRRLFSEDDDVKKNLVLTIWWNLFINLIRCSTENLHLYTLLQYLMSHSTSLFPSLRHQQLRFHACNLFLLSLDHFVEMTIFLLYFFIFSLVHRWRRIFRGLKQETLFVVILSDMIIPPRGLCFNVNFIDFMAKRAFASFSFTLIAAKKNLLRRDKFQWLF